MNLRYDEAELLKLYHTLNADGKMRLFARADMLTSHEDLRIKYADKDKIAWYMDYLNEPGEYLYFNVPCNCTKFEPILQAGDKLLVHLQDTVSDGDIALVKFSGGGDPSIPWLLRTVSLRMQR